MRALAHSATTTARSDPKGEALREHATLNPHPEQVTDALFQTQPFFDPRDLVQVKYEMLREVQVGNQPVSRSAAALTGAAPAVAWHQAPCRLCGVASTTASPVCDSILPVTRLRVTIPLA